MTKSGRARVHYRHRLRTCGLNEGGRFQRISGKLANEFINGLRREIIVYDLRKVIG